MSYPERQGWDLKLLARHDYRTSSHERSLPEVLAFLQTWLYFGFLAAFLDEPIDIKKFIDVNRSGDAVITTKSLPDYLVPWAVRMRVLSSNERKRLYLKKGQIITVVADYSRVLNHRTQNSPHTLPKILGLSIAILGERSVVQMEECWEPEYAHRKAIQMDHSGPGVLVHLLGTGLKTSKMEAGRKAMSQDSPETRKLSPGDSIPSTSSV